MKATTITPIHVGGETVTGGDYLIQGMRLSIISYTSLMRSMSLQEVKGLARDPSLIRRYGPEQVAYSVLCRTRLTSGNAVAMFMRDGNGTPYLPASSVKGALLSGVAGGRREEVAGFNARKTGFWVFRDSYLSNDDMEVLGTVRFHGKEGKPDNKGAIPHEFIRKGASFDMGVEKSPKGGGEIDFLGRNRKFYQGVLLRIRETVSHYTNDKNQTYLLGKLDEYLQEYERLGENETIIIVGSGGTFYSKSIYSTQPYDQANKTLQSKNKKNKKWPKRPPYPITITVTHGNADNGELPGLLKLTFDG